MIGDKLVIKPHHTRAAEGVYFKIRDKILNAKERIAITVSGESGSGKSEVAAEIARVFLEKNGFQSIILHQDDYFIYPPKTNDEVRREDIKNVGMHEVKLVRLDNDISSCKVKDEITKPLIDYDKNTVFEENIELNDVKIIIAEGTYTTTLKKADIHIFIDRTYHDTLQHRKERARDKIDNYTEKILKIEHEIISNHKKLADVVIDKNYKI